MSIGEEEVNRNPNNISFNFPLRILIFHSMAFRSTPTLKCLTYMSKLSGDMSANITFYREHVRRRQLICQ